MSISFIVIVVLLLAAAIAGLGYMRISSVKSNLQDAARHTQAYFSALESNPNHSKHYLDRAQRSLDKADKNLATVPFPQVEWAPGVGQNVVAVRTVVGELRKMTRDTGPTLTTVATVIDFRTGKPRAHDSAREWAQTVKNAAKALKDVPDALESFNDSADEIAKVDTSGLFPPVRDPLDKLQDQVSGAQKNIKTVSRAVNTLSPVLRAIP